MAYVFEWQKMVNFLVSLLTSVPIVCVYVCMPWFYDKHSHKSDISALNQNPTELRAATNSSHRPGQLLLHQKTKNTQESQPALRKLHSNNKLEVPKSLSLSLLRMRERCNRTRADRPPSAVPERAAARRHVISSGPPSHPCSYFWRPAAAWT